MHLKEQRRSADHPRRRSARPLPASPSATASSTSTVASSPASSAASVASPIASSSNDGRSDPSAFASNLNWTDITKQLSAAVGDNKHTFSYAKATMQVPLNWADVTGKKISITVLRIRSASQKNRIGSLVVNPGGPGGSGIEAALSFAVDEFPDAILNRFDIVGFDPRGIGLSDPIQCITDKQKDAELNLPADPKTAAQWQAEIADATKVAQECYTEYGSDLTYYSTAETARDMEALRAKLGDPKLTYIGYSYGTLIGAEYASAYPDKVRALVLDGAVDPTISSIDQDKTQAAGFQLAFSHFAASCTAKGSSCKLGSDPQQYVLNLEAKAAAHPIPSGDSSDKRTADDGAVLLGVISALYDETQWPDLITALADANKGDASGILSLDDQYNEREYGRHLLQPRGCERRDRLRRRDSDDRPSRKRRRCSRYGGPPIHSSAAPRRPAWAFAVCGKRRPISRSLSRTRAPHRSWSSARQATRRHRSRALNTSPRCSGRAGCWSGRATGIPPTPRRRASPTT